MDNITTTTADSSSLKAEHFETFGARKDTGGATVLNLDGPVVLVMREKKRYRLADKLGGETVTDAKALETWLDSVAAKSAKLGTTRVCFLF